MTVGYVSQSSERRVGWWSGTVCNGSKKVIAGSLVGRLAIESGTEGAVEGMIARSLQTLQVELSAPLLLANVFELGSLLGISAAGAQERERGACARLRFGGASETWGGSRSSVSVLTIWTRAHEAKSGARLKRGGERAAASAAARL
ncbi:hypothetical protein FGB62_4g116 [Gracilaria domingensis]|nr:hypothetical protein FGB62_4g116 [Gracilaria domingensis]